MPMIKHAPPVADPLTAARIEIVAHDAVKITGLKDGATVELAPNRRIVLPAHEAPTAPPTIFVPARPIVPVHGRRPEKGPVEAIDEDAIRALPRGEPIVVGVTRVRRFDLRAFRAPAAQAATHGRALVIVVGERG